VSLNPDEFISVIKSHSRIDSINVDYTPESIDEDNTYKLGAIVHLQMHLSADAWEKYGKDFLHTLSFFMAEQAKQESK
jgi:hypothetical protein